MRRGRVYLVGAGPGDPGLLTLRGRQALSQADVVLYDHLVSLRLLDYAPKEAEQIYVGKRASAHTLAQDKINRLLVRRARAGATVVRLKGGDPMVFGRGGEEALALAEAGVEFEVVPGVTAGVAAAAYAGIPVTHRQMASSVAFVTGHEAADKPGSTLDWEVLARWKGTLAFYMSVGNLAEICRNLTAHGLDPKSPACIVGSGTTPRQQVASGCVGSLPELAEAAGIKPPAMIYVGPTVALRERLKWFERRPLFGRRIVVTRARRQAAQLTARLETLGAEVVQAPAIRIEPPEDPTALKRAVRNLEAFDWIVLTSVNGVEAFFGALAEAGLDARALAPNRVCVIGTATGERLAGFGVRADVIPETFTGEAIARTLAALENLSGKRILCPRADVAPSDLVEGLAARGAKVHELTAYRTLADNSGADRVAGMLARQKIDWLTFTSSSTARNFLAAVDAAAVRSSKARVASIGPRTSATLKKFGLEPAAEADPHTVAGLVDAILQQEKAAPG